MARIVCSLAVASLLTVLVSVPATAAASSVTTGDVTGNPYGYPQTVHLNGTVDSVDCPEGQQLKVAFDYARDDVYTSGGHYDQSGYVGQFSGPTSLYAWVQELTTGVTYHYRIKGWCEATYGGGTTPPPGAAIIYGADRIFVCCESGSSPGGGAGGGGDADTTPPVITITTPQPGATYTQDQKVTAVYECKDAESTVTQCSGSALYDNLPTSTVGTHTFTVTAKNSAGRTSTASSSYTVNPSKTVGGTFGPDGTKLVEDGSWFPSTCNPTDQSFNIITCATTVLAKASAAVSKAVQVAMANLWPAKKGTGVVGGDGKPAAFQYPDGGKVIAVGAGHVINVGAGHVVNVGAGHVVNVGAGHVIATGAGHVVGCTQCKVFDASGKVVNVGAGHVVNVGAGHVVNVGAGHVVNVGAGHRPAARAAAVYATVVQTVTRNVVAPAAGVVTQKLSNADGVLAKGRAKFTAAGVRPLTLRVGRAGKRAFARLANLNRKRMAADKRARSMRLTLTTRFDPRKGKTTTRKRTFRVTPGVP